VARIGRDHRADRAGNQDVGLVPRIGAVAAREPRTAKNLRRSDDLAEEQRRRHWQQFTTLEQRRAPSFDGFREARILRALRAANLFAPFAAGNLEQIARFAPGVHDPVQMRTDQPRHAFPRAAGFVDRRQHGCVIPPEDFQE
jgi:hypothetical protein